MKYILYALVALMAMASVFAGLTAGSVTTTSIAGTTGTFTSLTLGGLSINPDALQTTAGVQYVKSDGSVAISGTIEVTDINATSVSRKMYSSEDITVTICSSGCNYTKVQYALDRIPLFLFHKYRVLVSDGYYDEDVYIPSFQSKRTNTTYERTALALVGNAGTPTNVIFKSVFVDNAYGTIPVHLKGFSVNASNPYDNEDAGIGIYGSQEVLLQNISFLAGTNGIVCYSSRCMLDGVDFGGELTNDGIKVKHGGYAITEKVPHHNFAINGTTGAYVLYAADGIIFYQSEDATISGGTANVGTWNGFVLDTSGQRLYGINYIDNNLTDLNVSSKLKIGTLLDVGDAIYTNKATSVNVGFGTELPSANVHIYNNGASTNKLRIEEDGTGDASIQYVLSSTQSYALGIDNSDSDSYKLEVGSAVGGGTTVYKVSTSGVFQIGDGLSQKNITMTSPDGTEYTCGVANGGAFSCS